MMNANPQPQMFIGLLTGQQIQILCNIITEMGEKKGGQSFSALGSCHDALLRFQQHNPQPPQAAEPTEEAEVGDGSADDGLDATVGEPSEEAEGEAVDLFDDPDAEEFDERDV